MFITPAYAQGMDGGGAFIQIFPILLIVVIFYFLLIRPQQKRAREHQSMVGALRRGDTIVSAGGVIGKVTRVIDEYEAEVEIAEGVRVRILKNTITNVRSKTEPADTPGN